MMTITNATMNAGGRPAQPATFSATFSKMRSIMISLDVGGGLPLSARPRYGGNHDTDQRRRAPARIFRRYRDEHRQRFAPRARGGSKGCAGDPAPGTVRRRIFLPHRG